MINTASTERLNATFRERLTALTRRGRVLVRRTLTLQHGRYLIGTVSHCCTPHASLTCAGRETTPAMAAGITDYGWTVQKLLSFPALPPRWTPPKQRGRSAHALQRLIVRWRGDDDYQMWSYLLPGEHGLPSHRLILRFSGACQK